MPSSVPLPPSYDDGTGVISPFGIGSMWASTDHSTSGSPPYLGHNVMNAYDQGLTGASDASLGGGGNTHVYVGTLVLIALAGIILFHIAGFRFTVNAGVGK